MSIRTPPPPPRRPDPKVRDPRSTPAVPFALVANLLGLLIVTAAAAGLVVACWWYDSRLGLGVLSCACGAVGWRLTLVTDGGS